MKRSDLWAALVIGAAVGLLSQPILANIAGQFNLSLTFALRAEVFVGFTILAPIALYILYLLSRLVKVLYQFGKFAAVGTLNSFVDIGVLNLEILLFGTPGVWGYRFFKGISFLAATTNSYAWNKLWTFEVHEPANVAQAVKFYAAAVIGFLLNVGFASYVFSDVGRPAGVLPNVWANVGALSGIAASFLWDFLAYKYLVFKKPPVRPGPAPSTA
jgi:putative flippase GtrA